MLVYVAVKTGLQVCTVKDSILPVGTGLHTYKGGRVWRNNVKARGRTLDS